MGQLYRAAFLSLLLLSLTSCSSTSQVLKDKNYRIDYYSGGGFTGIENGVTIFNNGKVKFWTKKLNSARQVTDSLTMTDEQIIKFDSLVNNPEIFTFSHKFAGNFTTHLVLTNDVQFNQISYNGSDIPSEMPNSIRDLISEIKTIIHK